MINSHELEWTCQHGAVNGLLFGDFNPQQKTIICLHGWLDNAASFSLLAPKLADNFNVFVIDFPGHGLSQPLPEGSSYYIWDMVEIIWQLQQELQLQYGFEKYYLLGHSMGAITANLFAATFAGDVAGLMMLDALGPLTDDHSNTSAQLAKGIKERLKPASKATTYQSVEQAVAARIKSSPNLSIGAMDALVKRNLKIVMGGFQWRTDVRLRRASKIRLSEGQLQSFCQQVACPTLAILAEQGIVPKDWLQKRQAYYHNIELDHLPGHHHFHLEKKCLPAIVSSIEGFLAKN